MNQPTNTDNPNGLTILDKNSITITITNNVTAHATSYTMSLGCRMAVFDETLWHLRDDLKSIIWPKP